MKVAILYDFDKTLSGKDMQEFGFFDDIGVTNANDFWSVVKNNAEAEEMDHILAYLREMIVHTQKLGIKLSK